MADFKWPYSEWGIRSKEGDAMWRNPSPTYDIALRDPIRVMVLIVLAASLLLGLMLIKGRLPNTFGGFINFDSEGNLIHIFSEEIFGLSGEREVTIPEGQAITWGWEWFDAERERIEDILEGSTTSLEVDGTQMLGDGRAYWSDIWFFPIGYDQDGDGFGDTDSDGIGDTPPGFISAFRFTKVLGSGTHTWSFRFTDRTGLVTFNDSGIIIVLPSR